MVDKKYIIEREHGRTVNTGNLLDWMDDIEKRVEKLERQKRKR